MNENHVAIYSIDENVSFGKLASVDVDKYDKKTIDKFFEWTQKKQIKYKIVEKNSLKKVRSQPSILYYQ